MLIKSARRKIGAFILPRAAALLRRGVRKHGAQSRPLGYRIEIVYKNVIARSGSDAAIQLLHYRVQQVMDCFSTACFAMTG